MSDFKSKLPDFKELTSMTNKLYKGIKASVEEIIRDYKQKRAEEEVKEKAAEETKKTGETPAAKKTVVTPKSTPETPPAVETAATPVSEETRGAIKEEDRDSGQIK